MTGKDHVNIARVLREDIPGGETRITACEKFADMLAADNPRFDRNEFYKACGGIVTELYGPSDEGITPPSKFYLYWVRIFNRIKRLGK